MIVSRHLPLVTMCSPTMAEDCSDARAVAGVVKREAPNVGEVGATVASEGGADSSSAIDTPLTKATTSGTDGMALVLRVEEVGPSEGSFIGSHPTDPRKALFMVNDMAKQAV